MIYSTIPTQAQWKNDRFDETGIAFTQACRQFKIKPGVQQKIKLEFAKDEVIKRIDDLIALNEVQIADAGEQLWLLFDTYSAIDYWLKENSRKVSHHKGRRSSAQQYIDIFSGIKKKAVLDLYSCVCNTLALRLNCTINVLPMKLELYFGKTLGLHGFKTDYVMHKAQYLSRAEVEKYRLVFFDKKAHMLPWWEKKSDLASSGDAGLVLAETKYSNEKTADKEAIPLPNEAGFVMGMGSEFYVAPHKLSKVDGASDGFYHSSYLNGGSLLCAGSLIIEGGVFKHISNKSGHYRPTATHVLHALNALAIHGISYNNISVEIDDGEKIEIFNNVTEFKQYLAKTSFSDRSQGIEDLNSRMDQSLRKQEHKHYQQHIRGINTGESR